MLRTLLVAPFLIAVVAPPTPAANSQFSTPSSTTCVSVPTTRISRPMTLVSGRTRQVAEPRALQRAPRGHPPRAPPPCPVRTGRDRARPTADGRAARHSGARRPRPARRAPTQPDAVVGIQRLEQRHAAEPKRRSNAPVNSSSAPPLCGATLASRSMARSISERTRSGKLMSPGRRASTCMHRRGLISTPVGASAAVTSSIARRPIPVQFDAAATAFRVASAAAPPAGSDFSAATACAEGSGPLAEISASGTSNSLRIIRPTRLRA